MIRFDRVGKHYPPDRQVLSNIDFTIERGEMTLLCGPCGSGKTTLLSLIAAIEKPSTGAIFVNDIDVAALRRSALPFLRRNIGIVFQQQTLLFDRSVIDNVLLPLDICGCARREALQRAEAALDMMGLLARKLHHPGALCGGERQRLAIARAVAHRPALLLADEPTAHLDAAAAADTSRILAEFHRVGVTVVVASRQADLLPCARSLRLVRGVLQ